MKGITGGKGGGGGESSQGGVEGSRTLDRTTSNPDLWDTRPHERGGGGVREREEKEGRRLNVKRWEVREAARVYLQLVSDGEFLVNQLWGC
jgi:hypothetical protein